MMTSDWLKKRAFLTPERTALVTERVAMTFADLHQRADEVAGTLLDLGVEPDDHVAVLSGNSARFVVLLHALIRCRAVLVPINTRLSDDEISWQLMDVDARWLLYDDDQAERVGRLQPSIENDVTIARLRHVFDDHRVSPLRSLPAGIDMDRVQGIIYTSGTTGKPKGALLTFKNHWWSAVGSALHIGLHDDDRWLLVLPLFHIGGLAILFRSVIYGTTVELHRRFCPEAVNEAIDKHGVTMVSVVPTMLRRMIDVRRGKAYPSSLRLLLTGGSSVPLPLLRACEQLGAPVAQTYGMTETASQAATLSPENAFKKSGSSGKPLFPTDMKIKPFSTSDGGAPGPSSPSRTEIGEIYVRGPNVSPGYYESGTDINGQVNRSDHSRWFPTGDAGYIDEDGYLYVVDRLADLIISGGENIYPKEVEDVLESHPHIEEAAVVGVRDDEWGSVPVAFVAMKTEHFMEDEIIHYCRTKLASFKVPKQIIRLESLPKNPSGKVLRQHLQTLAERAEERSPLQ